MNNHNRSNALITNAFFMSAVTAINSFMAVLFNSQRMLSFTMLLFTITFISVILAQMFDAAGDGEVYMFFKVLSFIIILPLNIVISLGIVVKDIIVSIFKKGGDDYYE